MRALMAALAFEGPSLIQKNFYQNGFAELSSCRSLSLVRLRVNLPMCLVFPCQKDREKTAGKVVGKKMGAGMAF